MTVAPSHVANDGKTPAQWVADFAARGIAVSERIGGLVDTPLRETRLRDSKQKLFSARTKSRKQLDFFLFWDDI